MSLGRLEIARNAAKASGLSPEKCDEVLDHLVTVLGTTLKSGGQVMVDGFGTFGPTPIVNAQVFRPAATLTEQVERAPMPAAIAEALDTIADRPAVTSTPRVLPLRPEDAAIIEQWLSARQGMAPRRDTAALLFPQEDEYRPVHFGTEGTVKRGRGALSAFARRCDVPLVQVGLTGRRDELGAIYRDATLRHEVLAYWERYAADAAPRLARVKQRRDEQGGAKLPTAYRTGGWQKFIAYAIDFYQWLIEEGRRPKGTNPVLGARKAGVVDFSGGGKILIVRPWYAAVLRYPLKTPEEWAIIALLCNGLRADEVVRVTLAKLSLSARDVWVVGKGKKLRRVLLQPFVVEALSAYLDARRHSVAPWLFPAKRGDGPVSYAYIYGTVRSVAARVFPADNQQQQRRHIHPHGFRHYYITTALEHGMYDKAIADQTGHSSMRVFTGYVTMDDVLVEKEVRKLRKAKWF